MPLLRELPDGLGCPRHRPLLSQAVGGDHEVQGVISDDAGVGNEGVANDLSVRARGKIGQYAMAFQIALPLSLPPSELTPGKLKSPNARVMARPDNES